MILCAVRVTQCLHRLSNGRVVLTEPKTAKGRRSVALSPASVLDLRQHHAEQKELRDTVGIPLSDADTGICQC